MTTPPARVRRGRAVTALFAVILAAAAIVGIARERVPLPGFIPGVSASEDLASLTVPVRPISSIAIEGVWDVAVTIGEVGSDSLTIEVPARIDVDRFVVQDENGRIVLRGVPGARRSRANVTVSSLNRVSIDGAASLVLSGLNSEDFTLDIDGAANVTANSGTVDRLSVSLDGAADVDLSQIRAIDADISLDGAGQVRITMAGGTLRGSIDGVGRIVYGGEVSERNVSVSGLGRVQEAD